MDKKKTVPSDKQKKNDSLTVQSVSEGKPKNVENYVLQKLNETTQSDETEQNISAKAPSVKAKRPPRKKNKPRKSKIETETTHICRYSPDTVNGLNAGQVSERTTQGLVNETNQKYSKSYASIFIGNLLTFFNLLCILATAALIYSHASVSQYLFVVIFSLNIGFGIVTEIAAKKKIDKLTLLTSATTNVIRDGETREIPSTNIVLDDIVSLSLGNQIPADCILLDGNIEVNESLLTGESVPVKKTPGDLLYAGSFISGGNCKARADKVGADTYLNTLSSKAKRYTKPNSELMKSSKLIILIIGILIVPIAGLMFPVNWVNYNPASGLTQLNDTIQRTVSVVIGMIPSGMLLLTSVALTLGILRLMAHNTLVQDLYSLEGLARVNVLCLDKTGTITDGRMKVNDCMLLSNPTDFSVNEIIGSCLNYLNDNNQTSIALYNYFGHNTALTPTDILPFSSSRKLSAVTFSEIGTIAIGAPEFIMSTVPKKVSKIVTDYATMGLRVLLVAHSTGKINGDKLPSGFKPLAVISLSDNIRDDAAQTIRWFRENDVAIKVISGDNPVTVSEVARRVGVPAADKYISLEGLSDNEVVSVANKYTVFGRVTPEQKAVLVKAIKSEGHTVAMTGDGVNDILAMKEADCAVSFASGSDAAKNVSHIVLLDNNFSSMPRVVFEGRRVINNIQNSSSLYLMKTFFTIIFAVLSIIGKELYPFKTNNLMLLEFFVIGAPSFFLSLQPNTNRVEGNFFSFVLSRSVPCAAVLVLAVQSIRIIGAWQPEYFTDNYDELSTLIISFTGLVMLYHVCLPFNLYRASMFIGMVALCFIGLGFMPTTFLGKVYYPDFVSVLYIMVVVLISFPITNTFIKLFDKLRKRKTPTEKSINNIL